MRSVNEGSNAVHVTPADVCDREWLAECSMGQAYAFWAFFMAALFGIGCGVLVVFYLA